MILQFPTKPTIGTVHKRYRWDGTVWARLAITSGGLDFPQNPAVGDVYRQWKWDGEVWVSIPGPDGTVTSITAGTGLDGGTITTSGTLSLDASIQLLNDVGPMLPVSGEVLGWNGSRWIDVPVAATGITSLGALDDVLLTNQQNGQVLAWNAASQEWINSTLPAPVNLLPLDNVWEGTNEFTNSVWLEGLAWMSGAQFNGDGTFWLGMSNDYCLYFDGMGRFTIKGNLTMPSIQACNDVGVMTGLTNGQALTWNGSRWINGTPTGGTVTSITAGAGLVSNPGPGITTSGTISMPNVNSMPGVTNNIDNIWLDQQGRVTNVQGGTRTLANLAGVSISNPTSGQYLSYDGSHWYNSPFPVGTLQALGDVGAMTPVAGQNLSYNGSRWLNVTPPPAGAIISATAPANPQPGQMWWRTDTGQLMVWYVQNGQAQWVIANSGGGAWPPQGVTDGSDAPPGAIGEYIGAINGVSMTNGVVTNFTSINLTAGDWDVSTLGSYIGGTANFYFRVGMSTVSATLQGVGTFASVDWGTAGMGTLIGSVNISSPPYRLNVTSTTTVYCVGQSSFQGTAAGTGYIRARRVR